MKVYRNGALVELSAGEAAAYAALQDAPPDPSAVLDAAKMDAKRRVIARADQIADAITGYVPLSERLSWPKKEAAALAYDANTATPSQLALLQAETSVTGETVAALAAKIISNAATYTTAAGLIAGQRRKTLEAIDALTDPATVAADLAAIFQTAEAQAQALLAQLTA